MTMEEAFFNGRILACCEFCVHFDGKLRRLHNNLEFFDTATRRVKLEDFLNSTRLIYKEAVDAAAMNVGEEQKKLAVKWVKIYEGYIDKIKSEAERWGIELEPKEKQEKEPEPSKRSKQGRLRHDFRYYLEAKSEEEKDGIITRIHTAMKGKKGKDAVAVIMRANQMELFHKWPSYPAFKKEFGDEVTNVSDQTYSKYGKDGKACLDISEYSNIVL